MSARSNPFEELERLFERMSEQFDQASSRWETGEPLDWFGGKMESMAIDLVEQDDAFVATVDLPGFERDEIETTVTDSTLRIRAEREEATEEEAEQYLRRERRHESTSRSIRLPEEVDTEAVTATMHNGVLTVTLPRLDVEEATEIDIE